MMGGVNFLKDIPEKILVSDLRSSASSAGMASSPHTLDYFTPHCFDQALKIFSLRAGIHTPVHMRPYNLRVPGVAGGVSSFSQ